MTKALWVLMLCLALPASACNLPARPNILSTYNSKLGVKGKVRKRAHRGVDFYAPRDAEVQAVADGHVVHKSFSSEIGWVVMINHEDHRQNARYLHLNSVDVAMGDRVLRGQRIGDVGLFEFSGGIPHVHLELRDRYPVALKDPLEFSSGCFDPEASYGPASPLTYPIRCSESIWNEPRPYNSRLAAGDISVEASSLANSIGMGTRAVIDTGIPIADFRVFAGLRAAAGKSQEPGTRYEGRLLTGLGVANKVFDFAVLSGIGTSFIPEVAPRGIEVPILSFLRLKRGRVLGNVWFRATRIFSAPSRKEGANIPVFGADEFAVGLSTRIPPSTRIGAVASVEYQELLNDRMVTIGIGASFDSFWSH